MVVRWLPFTCLIWNIIVSASATKNAVIGVSTKCDQDSLNVTLLFEAEFKGLIYSKGFSRTCNASGTMDDIVTLNLDPARCGLRITKAKDGDGLEYTTTIQVQMSPSLQQVNDPTLPVTCTLNQDLLTLHTKKAQDRNRTGRGMSHPARAWMEVRGSAISAFSNALSVGEHTTLAIYTSLPEGVDGLPVECLVHDGQGTKQALSDRRGCPVDPQLVPKLKYDPDQSMWATAFPAFTFPDSPLVHYPDCEPKDENNTRSSRDFEEVNESSIIDIVELYNSVEVEAPNIELGYLKKELEETIQGMEEMDRALCLSAPRMAIVFAILGSVFLCAILASLCIILRNRRSYLSHNDLMDRTNLLVIRPPSPNSLWSLRI